MKTRAILPGEIRKERGKVAVAKIPMEHKLTQRDSRNLLGHRGTPRLRAPIINKFMASQQRQDVMQDVVIWSRKQYLSAPRLNRSDGEITTYRSYCAQFYPDPSDCGRSIA